MHSYVKSFIALLITIFMVGCGDMPTDPMVDNNELDASRQQLDGPVLDDAVVSALIQDQTAGETTTAGKTSGQYVIVAHHATFRDVSGDVPMLQAYYYYQVRNSNFGDALIDGAVEITCVGDGDETDNCLTTAIAFSYEQAIELDQLRGMFTVGLVDLNTDLYMTLVARIHGDGSYGDITFKRLNAREGTIIVVPNSEFRYHFEGYVARSEPQTFSLDKPVLRGYVVLGQVAENMLLVTWGDIERLLGDRAGSGVIVSVHVMDAGGTTLAYESDLSINESRDDLFGEDFVKVQVAAKPELAHLNISSNSSSFGGDHWAFTLSVKEFAPGVYGLDKVVNEKG